MLLSSRFRRDSLSFCIADLFYPPELLDSPVPLSGRTEARNPLFSSSALRWCCATAAAVASLFLSLDSIRFDADAEIEKRLVSSRYNRYSETSRPHRIRTDADHPLVSRSDFVVGIQ